MNDQEAGAALDAAMLSNECELTLDVVDKIALRLMAAMMPSTGYYNKEGGNSQAYDAYEAADAFLKEKVKRDQFQIVVEEAEDVGDWDEEELDREPIAKVEFSMLTILGVTMFRDGDVCHDKELRCSGCTHWNIEQLQKLADRINKAI